MKTFDEDLAARLIELRGGGLYRELRRVDSPQGTRIEIGGQTLLNFSSNDYLGLANEPALKAAAAAAVEKYGAGSGASRLVCGSLAPHHELDEALAAFKGTPAALSFSSGYATALGAICAILDSNDVILVDKLVHACIVDAARLSRAKLRVFSHNDLDSVERILRWADRRQAGAAESSAPPRVLIVTESVFSMDGDQAPLRELFELKERYGAWLMVDEAHATGLYGRHRRGLAEETGIAPKVEIQMGTLGKAFGASGGYICGSRALIDCLINRARSFIFSTAPVPAAAAAAAAGVRLVQSEAGEERCRQLWANVAAVAAHRALAPKGTPLAERRGKTAAIIPIMIGDEDRAMDIARRLRERGVFIPAIRYPTVARGAARLRLTISAAHTAADIAQMLAALEAALNPTPSA
ncbi:MAG TPA: 8-amino-7-oxononanoate synthase [Candidatus Acidoferrum sp.]|nr:8-amino-7-oxononanoate synthase [Candidatus Acidoferrum sp.]